MENTKLKMRYNIMDINSPATFANVRGGMNRDFRDVYFVRMVGVSTDYLKDIERMDNVLTCSMRNMYVSMVCRNCPPGKI